MKQQLEFKKMRFGSITMILLLLFSCESQQLPEKEIQNRILQDEDFVNLLTEAFLLKSHAESNETQYQSEGLIAFDSNFELLDSRYHNFYNNAQRAMANKLSEEYIDLCERLRNSINGRLPSETARVLVYNGASICGQESCGNSAQDNTTVGCIAGATMADLYCTRNNMGNCNEMRNAIIDECCESFCH